MIKTFNYLFVTFFGIGKIKFASGTFASFATIILLYFLFYFTKLSDHSILILFIIIFILSFYTVAEYIKFNPNKDPKEVVVDEVIGQFIPIYFFETSQLITKNPNESILYYLYIFLLFRFFDITKPFPVNFFDKKLKNSFGVILDDVVAGIYVVFTLIIFIIIKSKFFSWI